MKRKKNKTKENIENMEVVGEARAAGLDAENLYDALDDSDDNGLDDEDGDGLDGEDGGDDEVGNDTDDVDDESDAGESDDSSELDDGGADGDSDDNEPDTREIGGFDDIDAGGSDDFDDADVESSDKNEKHKNPVKKRLYEDYVIDDPEDMDEAPDTGDMFDDEDLDDDDYYADEVTSGRRRKKTARRRQTGISGKTLAALWILLVILLGGYVYLFFINKTIISDDVTGRDNTVNIDIPAGANYSLCNIDEINQLIGNYLLARTKADQATLQRLVTDPEEFNDMTSVEIAAQYITAYGRTTCYMVPGYTSDSYIIYELSNLTIKDVNSNPLDIRSFYVTKQDDGSYKINNSSLSDEEQAYINDIGASDFIQDIYKHVKENNDYLSKHDDTFKKFQDMYE